MTNETDSNVNKGKTRPSWDEYFMGLMFEVAKRATCDRGMSGCFSYFKHKTHKIFIPTRSCFPLFTFESVSLVISHNLFYSFNLIGCL